MLGYDRSRFGEIDHLTPLGHLACYVVETSAAATATVRAMLDRRVRSGRHLRAVPLRAFLLAGLTRPTSA
jgi:hypothetical protein